MFSFADKRPFNVPLVVIDTEPTGLLPQRGQRAVEIGAIRDEDGEEVGQIKALLVWIGCKEFTQPDQFG